MGDFRNGVCYQDNTEFDECYIPSVKVFDV